MSYLLWNLNSGEMWSTFSGDGLLLHWHTTPSMYNNHHPHPWMSGWGLLGGIQTTTHLSQTNLRRYNNICVRLESKLIGITWPWVSAPERQFSFKCSFIQRVERHLFGRKVNWNIYSQRNFGYFAQSRQSNKDQKGRKQKYLWWIGFLERAQIEVS